MKKLNITPGEWYIGELRNNIYSKKEYNFKVSIYQETEYDKYDNLILIADAGTTYNQCGLLPSELLKQRDELLKKCNQKLSIETTDLQDILHDYRANRISLFQVKQQILKAIQNI